jgi:prevent-host-death family protein
MSSTCSVAEAQTQLPRLIRQAEQGDAVRIRRRNDTVAYLVSRERMEAIVETMELANPDALKAIAAHRAGKIKFPPLSALARSPAAS